MKLSFATLTVLAIQMGYAPIPAQAGCDQRYAKLDRILSYALESGYSINPAHPGVHHIPITELRATLKTYDSALEELARKRADLSAKLMSESDFEQQEAINTQLNEVGRRYKALKKEKASTALKRLQVYTPREYELSSPAIQRQQRRGTTSQVVVTDRSHNPDHLADYNPPDRQIRIYETLPPDELEQTLAHELVHGKAFAAPVRIRRDRKGRIRGHPFTFWHTLRDPQKDGLTHTGFNAEQHASEATAFRKEALKAIQVGKDPDDIAAILTQSLEATVRNYWALRTAREQLRKDKSLSQYLAVEDVGKVKHYTYSIPCGITETESKHFLKIRFLIYPGDQPPTYPEFEEYLGFLFDTNYRLFGANAETAKKLSLD